MGLLPESIICVAAFLLLAITLCQCLSLIHLRNLQERASVESFQISGRNITCSGPVASSADLSSRIRIKRGKRKEIPRSSAYIRKDRKQIEALVKEMVKHTNP